MKTYLGHLNYNFKMLVRLPGFWVPTLLFPAMLYGFFGASLAGQGEAAKYAVASFCVYAVIGVGFFQFGAGIAQERETAHAVWQKSLPVNWLIPWIARVTMTAIFSLLAVLLVLILANLLTDIDLSAGIYLKLLASCLIAAIPSTLMGMALGYMASARSAVAIANLIFLPIAFLGGLWVPPHKMPESINAISVWTPTRQMGELAWSAVSGFDAPSGTWPVLGGYTLLFLVLVWLAFKRDDQTRFG